MKKYIPTITLLLAATPAIADDSLFEIPGEFSGDVAITSDYTSRGLAQSDEKPALQGGLTYNLPLTDDLSVYAGIWGSNVDFNDGGQAHLELDYLLGAGYTIGDIALDAGLIFYEYPGADNSLDYDYYEYQANIGYDLSPVYLRSAVNYTPQNAANSGKAAYIKVAAEYSPMEDLVLTLRGGRQYVQYNSRFGVPDYNDWGVSATYTFKEIDFTAEYVENNIDSASCGMNCDGKVLFSASKSF